MGVDMHCRVRRSSDRIPPCDGCISRPYRWVWVKEGSSDMWCITFKSADAFMAWLRALDEPVVIGLFLADQHVLLDGQPAPEWDIEIYDDYRE